MGCPNVIFILDESDYEYQFVPGFMEGTRMSANWSPAYAAGAADRTPLKCTVDKDDVAEQLITFCRSDSVTGQTVLMDSGRV